MSKKMRMMFLIIMEQKNNLTDNSNQSSTTQNETPSHDENKWIRPKINLVMTTSLLTK